MPMSYKYDIKSSEYYDRIDNAIKNKAISIGAKELIVSPIISEGVLRELGYFNHSKDKLIATMSNNLNEFYLSPAACLNVYGIFKNNMNTNSLVTVKSPVFRNENDSEHYTIFNVREIVALGNKEFVQNSIKKFYRIVDEFCLEENFDYEILNASDLFFPSRENEILKQLQLNSGNKKEIVVKSNNSRIVIGSINYHGTHFSKTFDFDDNNKIVTACIGFGIERIITVVEEKNMNDLNILMKSLSKIKYKDLEDVKYIVENNKPTLNDTPLILDSLNIVDLIVSIEELLQKEIPSSLLDINHFNTIGGVLNLIRKVVNYNE